VIAARALAQSAGRALQASHSTTEVRKPSKLALVLEIDGVPELSQ